MYKELDIVNFKGSDIPLLVLSITDGKVDVFPKPFEVLYEEDRFELATERLSLEWQSLLKQIVAKQEM